MTTKNIFPNDARPGGEREPGYWLAFHSNPLPMWVYDRETLSLLEINAAAERLYGYTHKEFMGMSLGDLAVETMPPPGPPPYTGETRHRTRDGRVDDLEIHAEALRFAGRDAVIVVALDITQRKRQEENLQKREQYFRHLTENALDLITILNSDGTIQYESPSMEKVLGYRPEDYLGRSAFEFVHADDLPRVTHAFLDALQRNGNTPTLAFRFRHKDGSWHTLEGIGNNLLADPVVAGIVFNSRDITERQRLEEQFFQSQKVQAIGQLAGGVAHDFNNILTAIIGYSDLMLRQLKPGDPLHGNATEIKKAADRASGLTRQLLAFSRKQVLQPHVLDLNQTIAGLENMLRRLLGEQIVLATAPYPGLGHVKVDPGQIEQVLLNLSVNARDAMPTGGRLLIETNNVQLSQEYHALHPEVTPGDYILLAVSDTGTGIPPEVLARLFEPFFTTKEQGKGTGLGLATCHGIVKQSGGHIAVYSEPGHGSTFKVYLPRVDEPLEPVAPRTAVPILARGRETILVVEDEPMLLDLAIIVLSDLGYRVLAADNGVQALRLFHQHAHEKIDLVITDVVMPEMGGKELTRKLQAISPATRVIYCSGYTQDAILQSGVLDPGLTFIQKPYTAETLATKIREVLQP